MIGGRCLRLVFERVEVSERVPGFNLTGETCSIHMAPEMSGSGKNLASRLRSCQAPSAGAIVIGTETFGNCSLTLPLNRVVLSPVITRPFCAVLRTSVVQTALD